MSTIRTEQDKWHSDTADGVNNSLTPGTTVHINDQKKHTGPFFAITSLADAVVDVSECEIGIVESDGSGAIQAIATDLTIPKGVTMYGNFHSIELDSGTVIAYAKKGITVTVEA